MSDEEHKISSIARDHNVVSLLCNKDQNAVFAVLTDNSLDAIRCIVAEEIAKAKLNGTKQEKNNEY
jgi:hypothetical protein